MVFISGEELVKKKKEKFKSRNMNYEQVTDKWYG